MHTLNKVCTHSKNIRIYLTKCVHTSNLICLAICLATLLNSLYAPLSVAQASGVIPKVSKRQLATRSTKHRDCKADF